MKALQRAAGADYPHAQALDGEFLASGVDGYDVRLSLDDGHLDAARGQALGELQAEHAPS